MSGGGGEGGGDSSEILKRTPKRYQDPHIIPSYVFFFALNNLKGIAKTLVVDLLRLNTL